MLEIADYFKLN